jgi:hypothetical protein
VLWLSLRICTFSFYGSSAGLGAVVAFGKYHSLVPRFAGIFASALTTSPTLATGVTFTCFPSMPDPRKILAITQFFRVII